MSRKNPTLAEALRVPGFTVVLERQFVDRMAALELAVAEHGKADGVTAWAAAEVRAIHLAYAEQRQIGRNGIKLGPGTLYAGGLYAEQVGANREKFYIVNAGDRAKLATARRKLGRWWLAQGVTLEVARTLVKEPDR